MLASLATRGKWAGEDVALQVWRDGKLLELKYRLPKYDYAISLVPFAAFDREPEYLILGGLVFQPLTDPYLQSWGPEWRRRAPFRLYHYREEPPTKERPALVLLSQVLPDAYNIGYQDYKCLVVDKVNGRRISHLAQLQDALEHALDGYHIIEFKQSDSLRRVGACRGRNRTTAGLLR